MFVCYSEQYDPWCATDLDDQGVMKNGKFKTCFDEDKITYDGGSEAQPCQLPFLMDRQYYETCTRKMINYADPLMER